MLSHDLFPPIQRLPAYCFAALIHFAILKNLLPNSQKTAEKHLLSGDTEKLKKSDSDNFHLVSRSRNMVLYYTNLDPLIEQDPTT